jgi:adenylate kinase
MRVVLLGPPGAGKGTHAKILSEKYHVSHLATGDILRKNIREKTSLGLKAKDVIERGELVNDDLVNEIMFQEITQNKNKKGYILDGYPRTIGQAEGLDRFLISKNSSLDVVVNFETSEEIIIDRLSGRRVCASTGRVYHLRNMPPKRPGVDDETGEPLITRKDDEPATVKNRLKVYHRETEPLIEFYEKKGLLVNINGDHEVPQLQKALKELFERLKISA